MRCSTRFTGYASNTVDTINSPPITAGPPGPTRRAIKRFESVGFEVKEFYGTFGHQYYYQIPPLNASEFAKARFLLRHPVPALTSYAVVVLRKPAQGQ